MLVEYCAPEDYDHERFMRGMRLLAKLVVTTMKREQQRELMEVETNKVKAPREGV